MKFFKFLTFAAVTLCMATMVGCEDETTDYIFQMSPLAVPAPYFDDTDISGSQLTLRWAAVPAANSYTVRWWKEGNEANAESVDVTTNYHTFRDLVDKTTYYAQVKANAYEGYESCNSDYSAVFFCTTDSDYVAPVPEPGEPMTLFEDDFEWVRPYAESVNQQDIVATNEYGTFQSYYAYDVILDGVSAYDDLLSRGYTVKGTSGEDLRYVIVMPGYLMFYCNSAAHLEALHLPRLPLLPGDGDDVWIDLEWCPSTSAAITPDTVCLTVEITNGSISKTFDSEPSTAGTQTLYWSHHVFKVEGVTIDSNVDICIRPIDQYWYQTDDTRRRYLVGGIKVYTE